MGRVLVVAAVMSLMPKACAEAFGVRTQPTAQTDPPPPPPPPAPSTTPPIFVLPESGPQPQAPPFVSPELAKARAAADAKDFKKVRTILEKKVQSGKANHEEAVVLLEACTALKDKVCMNIARKAYPDLEGL